MSEPETEVDRALTGGPLWNEGVEGVSCNEDAKGADRLRGEDRDLYESTRTKVLVSLVYGAFSIMLLGFCSECGGKSSALNQVLKRATDKNVSVIPVIDLGVKVYKYLDTTMISLLVGGVGFGAFCHFCAFVLSAAAAVYVSPLLAGSVKEAATLRGPVDFAREVEKRKSRRKSFSAVGL